MSDMYLRRLALVHALAVLLYLAPESLSYAAGSCIDLLSVRLQQPARSSGVLKVYRRPLCYSGQSCFGQPRSITLLTPDQAVKETQIGTVEFACDMSGGLDRMKEILGGLYQYGLKSIHDGKLMLCSGATITIAGQSCSAKSISVSAQ